MYDESLRGQLKTSAKEWTRASDELPDIRFSALSRRLATRVEHVQYLQSSVAQRSNCKGGVVTSFQSSTKFANGCNFIATREIIPVLRLSVKVSAVLPALSVGLASSPGCVGHATFVPPLPSAFPCTVCSANPWVSRSGDVLDEGVLCR